MDNDHAFDFPLGDLTPHQQQSLDAALAREGIDRQWLGTTVRVDVAYESRVSSLVDEARRDALPTAPMPSVGAAPTAPAPAAGPVTGLTGTTPYPPPAPAGYAPAPAGYGQAPAGYGQAPAGYGQAPAGYGQAPAGYGQAPGGYASPATTGYGYGGVPVTAPRTNGLAIASLILGIASLVTCAGLVLGIPAVVCGHLAKRQIRESAGLQAGEGLATAGLATGWIANALSIAGLVFWVALIVASAR